MLFYGHFIQISVRNIPYYLFMVFKNTTLPIIQVLLSSVTNLALFLLRQLCVYLLKAMFEDNKINILISKRLLLTGTNNTQIHNNRCVEISYRTQSIRGRYLDHYAIVTDIRDRIYTAWPWSVFVIWIFHKRDWSSTN